MTARRGSNGPAIALLAAALLAASAAAAAESPRAPVLLYISGSSAADLPDPVGEVRARTVALLHRSLADAGFGTVPAADLRPLLREHRVRSAWGTGAPFLAALADSTGASHLLVAVLLVEQQRLQLLARLVHLPSGCAVWAGSAEREMKRPDLLRGSLDAAAWYDALAFVARGCAPPADAAPAADGRALLLLPARGVACSPAVALTASYAALAPVAGDARWRVLDPGVAVTALQAAGVPHERLDAAGRRRIETDLGGGLVALPELVAWGAAAPRGVLADDARPASIDETIEEYQLNLRFVAVRTGAVAAGFSRHRDHGVQVGWFGLRKEVSLLAGLDAAAHEIWKQVNDTLEDR